MKIDLGGEQIDLVRLNSFEALSQSFTISVDMLASLGEIDLMPHLGKPASIALLEDDETQRYFHGILIDGELLHSNTDGSVLYRLTLRPKAYLHTQGRNFRIFQEKTVKDILTTMLDKCGIVYEMQMSAGGARKRAFCVQYGESDFGFISRLMEEEGIYYFYEHLEDKHKLVLCDSKDVHAKCAASPLSYNPLTTGVFNTDSAARTSAGAKKYMQSWHEIVSTGGETKVRQRDFDFMRASMIEASAEEQRAHDEDAIEIFSYPGRFYDTKDGEKLSKTLLHSRRANRRLYRGECQNGAIECGTVISLKEHMIERFNTDYLITQCEFTVSNEIYRSGDTGGGGTQIRLEAVPATVNWRAPITSRRPVVQGPETAIVTGPQGEQIHVDKYGRVKVKFHWDHEGKSDDTSSCWIRVSQTGGLGNIIIPRVGHEVLVDFINGDPDRPIVVGRVFNSSHMPVYTLPDHKTKAVWRTERYKEEGSYPDTKPLDTGRPGANELRFDDQGGKEEVFLHAERNMNTRIRFDETHYVGHNQTLDIGYDRVENVGHNEKLTVKLDQSEEIGANRTTTIKANDKLTVKANREVVTQGTDKLDAQGNITITSATKIELKVGASSIVMTPADITIKSTIVKVEGDASANIKSTMTQIEASAMLTAKGAIVMIN